MSDRPIIDAGPALNFLAPVTSHLVVVHAPGSISLLSLAGTQVADANVPSWKLCDGSLRQPQSADIGNAQPPTLTPPIASRAPPDHYSRGAAIFSSFIADGFA